MTYKDAYYGWERDNTHVFGHRVIAAYVAELEAALAALKGAIKALVEDCCGWPPPNDTFCESFGCSTLFRLAEGEIRS